MTLTEFLLARVAEDEAAARLAVGLKWHAQGGPDLRTIPHDSPGSVEPCWFQIARGGADDGPHADPVVGLRARLDSFRHIARHDPARVLAECEAKRRIVEEVVPHLEHVESSAIDGGMYDEDAPHAQRDLLRLLALPYTDHPDYREEWRP